MTSLGRMISGVDARVEQPVDEHHGLLAAAACGDPRRVSWPSGPTCLESEARRCQKIVNNLLSFARRREVRHGALSLNEVIESVLALVGYQLPCRRDRSSTPISTPTCRPSSGTTINSSRYS